MNMSEAVINYCTEANIIAWLKEAWKSPNPIALDIETTGLSFIDDKVLLIALGDEFNQYVINVQENEEFVRETPLLVDIEQIDFILHNGKFDYKFLAYQYGWEFKFVDTMIAEGIITNGTKQSKKLSTLLEKYNIEIDSFYKENKQILQKSFVGKISTNFNESEILYSAFDVMYLNQIFKKQLSLIEQNNLQELYKLECMVSPVYAKIEMNGIYLDKDSWNDTIVANELTQCSLESLLNKTLINELPKYKVAPQLDIFGNQSATTKVNWSSSAQVLKIFKELGIECKDNKGKESVADEVLASIDHELASLLSDHRTVSKRLSSFGKSFLDFVNPHTNCIHANFNQFGTDTGRVSCNEPNLQQIPAVEEYRSAFKAKPSDYKKRVLVTCDYEGMELRILADGSQDPVMLEAFRNKEDVHSKMASIMNGGIEVSKKVNAELRSRQKTINFGLAYGASAHKFKDVFDGDIVRANKEVNKFFNLFPNLRDYLESLGRIAIKKGYATTFAPYYRRRYFDISDIEDDFKKRGEIERAGKNMPIQGTCADIVKLATLRLQRKLDEFNTFYIDGLKEKRKWTTEAIIVNQVHDEIVVECMECEAEQILTIMKLTMIESAEEVLKHCPVEVSGTISDCWEK